MSRAGLKRPRHAGHVSGETTNSHAGAEEILLLVLDEGGRNCRGHRKRYARPMALVRSGADGPRISRTDRHDFDRLMLVDATPLGEDILDSTLAEIAGAEQEHDTGLLARKDGPDGVTGSAKPRSRA